MHISTNSVIIDQGRYAHPSVLALIVLPLSVCVIALSVQEVFYPPSLLLLLPFLLLLAAAISIQKQLQIVPQERRFRHALMLGKYCLGGSWKSLDEYKFAVLLKHKTKQRLTTSPATVGSYVETYVQGTFSGIKLHPIKRGEPELLLAAPQTVCVGVAQVFFQPNSFTLYKGVPKAGQELRFKRFAGEHITDYTS